MSGRKTIVRSTFQRFLLHRTSTDCRQKDFTKQHKGKYINWEQGDGLYDIEEQWPENMSNLEFSSGFQSQYKVDNSGGYLGYTVNHPNKSL